MEGRSKTFFIIDLSKPLVSRIKVDGDALPVEYEGLPTICYHCGRYGHLEEGCPQKVQVIMPATERPAAMDTSAPAEEAKYGPWMQVQRRGGRNARITKTQVEDSTAPIGRGGTRFDLLATSDEQRQELVREPAPHTGVTVSSKQPSETPKKKGKEVCDQRTMQSRSKKCRR